MPAAGWLLTVVWPLSRGTRRAIGVLRLFQSSRAPSSLATSISRNHFLVSLWVPHAGNRFQQTDPSLMPIPGGLPQTSGLQSAPTSLAELCSVLPLTIWAPLTFRQKSLILWPHTLTAFPLQPIPGAGAPILHKPLPEPLAELQAPSPGWPLPAHCPRLSVASD